MPSTSLPDELVTRVKGVVEEKYVAGFLAGSVSTVTVAFLYARYFRRFRTVGWITPNVYAKKRWLKGVVTK